MKVLIEFSGDSLWGDTDPEVDGYDRVASEERFMDICLCKLAGPLKNLYGVDSIEMRCGLVDDVWISLPSFDLDREEKIKEHVRMVMERTHTEDWTVMKEHTNED